MAKITKYTQNISTPQPPPSPLANISIPSGSFIFGLSIKYYAETTVGSFSTYLTVKTGNTVLYTSGNLSRRTEYNLNATISGISESSVKLTESKSPDLVTRGSSITVTAIE